ncbi:MAG: efflux RND transporter periplasmic adaptor subunit [Gammaproteobacteria bacterium]|nr:efflux RND transporter periplasmic adaptor subunit [Gammaproteobacteria bacterium]MDP6673812.1 efflux RND transporter periplasmic adaptor subunit [Gammaproteobacteria bacterium]
MKKVIVFIVVIGVLAGAYSFFGKQGKPSGRPHFGGPVKVVAEPVVRQPLIKTIEALGTALANESVTLTASLNETVRRVNFEDGEFVEAGTILVELSNEEEEAQLAEAGANLDEAKRQLARLVDLDKRGIAATSEVDGARSLAEAAEARLNTVIARLDDRLIRAPFSGVLGFRQVSPGSLLMAGTAITTLDDVAKIKLDFTVPETVLNLMKPGSNILARSVSWGDRDFVGVVRAVGSRVDPVTRAVVVRALIANEDRALRPGMLLTVRVITEEKQAFMVPERVVVQVGGEAFVYAVDSENVAHKQTVQLGTRQAGDVEIVSGVNEGDRIVTQGVIKLRNGSQVTFTDEAAKMVKKGRPR